MLPVPAVPPAPVLVEVVPAPTVPPAPVLVAPTLFVPTALTGPLVAGLPPTDVPLGPPVVTPPTLVAPPTPLPFSDPTPG